MSFPIQSWSYSFPQNPKTPFVWAIFIIIYIHYIFELNWWKSKLLSPGHLPLKGWAWAEIIRRKALTILLTAPPSGRVAPQILLRVVLLAAKLINFTGMNTIKRLSKLFAKRIGSKHKTSLGSFWMIQMRSRIKLGSIIRSMHLFIITKIFRTRKLLIECLKTWVKKWDQEPTTVKNQFWLRNLQKFGNALWPRFLRAVSMTWSRRTILTLIPLTLKKIKIM